MNGSNLEKALHVAVDPEITGVPNARTRYKCSICNISLRAIGLHVQHGNKKIVYALSFAKEIKIVCICKFEQGQKKPTKK
jgi:hypothetical protein